MQHPLYVGQVYLGTHIYSPPIPSKGDGLLFNPHLPSSVSSDVLSTMKIALNRAARKRENKLRVQCHQLGKDAKDLELKLATLEARNASLLKKIEKNRACFEEQLLLKSNVIASMGSHYSTQSIIMRDLREVVRQKCMSNNSLSKSNQGLRSVAKSASIRLLKFKACCTCGSAAQYHSKCRSDQRTINLEASREHERSRRLKMHNSCTGTLTQAKPKDGGSENHSGYPSDCCASCGIRTLKKFSGNCFICNKRKSESSD